MIEEFDTPHLYDMIVSGLPLTNFAPEHVERIMNCPAHVWHLQRPLARADAPSAPRPEEARR
ncbi:hypothetical protein [Streptomyces clavifer]|uniref:hypothetical protein n=1 Tax=Streptomyces clavifer TaxID=68188 RepID=UPI00364F5E3C